MSGAPDVAALASLYRTRAHRAATGRAGGPAVDPDLGTAACTTPMTQIYDYYGRLYLDRPSRLLWAGLARLAGAQVVHGLASAADLGVDSVDNAYCRMLIDTCRRIFADTAWLHEAFLDDAALAVELARRGDSEDRAEAGRARIWVGIASGDHQEIVAANLRMLAHEQLAVVQSGYDAFRADVRAVSRSVRAVHPYHNDFAGDDIGDPEQRWAWVRSMWEGWVGLTAAERTRLVRLPFDELRVRRFGTP